jgi:cytochrome c oxidase subunit II
MAVSSTQIQFDSLFGLFTYLAVAVGIVVFSFMIYLIVKYRENPSSRQPQDTPILGKQPQTRGHLRTVLLTVTLSTIIIVPLIVGSFGAVDSILSPPAQVCQGCAIEVTAHQFYWIFTYDNGTKPYQSYNILRVPLGENIRLSVTSADVFHDFGIIGYDIKTDAIPGRTNTIWFQPDSTGSFTIQCFELCGVGHATMKGTLIVMTQADYFSWYNSTVVH